MRRSYHLVDWVSEVTGLEGAPLFLFVLLICAALVAGAYWLAYRRLERKRPSTSPKR